MASERAEQLAAWILANRGRVNNPEKGSLTFHFAGTSWVWELKQKGNGDQPRIYTLGRPAEDPAD